MGFANPSDSAEILYGASGDVRNEINAFQAATSAGHYADETEIPGSLVIQSLVRATREINVYLQPVYAELIPFTTVASVPKYLDMVADDMATWFTLRAASAKVRTVGGAEGNEKRIEYYEKYVKEPDGILCQLRDRKLQLSELLNSYTDEIKMTREQGRQPIFDLDSDLNYRVDPGLENDIADARDT